MNKETYYQVLQAALWAYEGVSEEDLTTKYQIPVKVAHLGFQICLKLNLKEHAY